MLDKKLKEALELLGGKAVLEDQGKYFVLLTLKEFRKIKQEGLEGLTKQELVDKINNDIASWKFSQEKDKMDRIDLEEIGEIKDEEVRYEKTV
ncbi:MAG: hypothetical protein QG620_475 [Patescibacteria group bacterium]|nr:hypothetical protein [Patescibacteria group bacterium]